MCNGSVSSCFICNESGSDFSTRCDHKFHLDCLPKWTDESYEDWITLSSSCPACKGSISFTREIEDFFSKKMSFQDFLKSNPSENLIENFFQSLMRCGDMELLKEVCTQLDMEETPIINIVFEQAGILGNVEILLFLIELFGVSMCPSSAITRATCNGKLESVKFLIEQGVDCDHSAIDGAAYNGEFEMVKYLIELDKPCSIEAVDGASGSGHFEIVKYLIEKGKPCSFNAIDKAASQGHFEVIKFLIEHGKTYSPVAIDWVIHHPIPRPNASEIYYYLREHPENCTEKPTRSVYNKDGDDGFHFFD